MKIVSLILTLSLPITIFARSGYLADAYAESGLGELLLIRLIVFAFWFFKKIISFYIENKERFEKIGNFIIIIFGLVFFGYFIFFFFVLLDPFDIFPLTPHTSK